MSVSRTTLAKLISDQTLSTGIFGSLADQVAKILLSTGKTNELSSLMRDVQNSWVKHGYVEVFAKSAFSLSSNVKKDIERLVLAQLPIAEKIIIREEIDPSVIGGVTIEFDDNQLDMSIQSKINQFKQLAVSEEGK
jgi:F0F1-type ATP synthase delta subunit